MTPNAEKAFVELVDAIANPAFPLTDDARAFGGMLLGQARFIANQNGVSFISPQKRPETVEADIEQNENEVKP